MLALPGLGHGAKLRRACMDGDSRGFESASQLLAIGISPTSYDEAFERTSLHWAAWSGAVRIGEKLIAHWQLDHTGGKNMSLLQDLSGFTPLHLAAERGHLGFVQMVLRHGGAFATTTSRTSSGMMPVHYASYNGHLECALVLLRHMIQERHIDIQSWPTHDPLEAILDKSGQTPAALARSKGHTNLATALEGATRSPQRPIAEPDGQGLRLAQ